MGQLQASAQAQDALKTWVNPSPDATCGQGVQGEIQNHRNDSSHGAAQASQPVGIKSFRNLPAFGLLQHAAEQLPNHNAIIYGDHHWTYQDLNLDAIRAAAMLQRLGIRPGDRVGILLPNVPEFVIAANAIWRAGAVAIAISPLMVQSEVQDLLRKTGCHHVICLDMLSHLVHDGKNRTVQSLLVSIR